MYKILCYGCKKEFNHKRKRKFCSHPCYLKFSKGSNHACFGKKRPDVIERNKTDKQREAARKNMLGNKLSIGDKNYFWKGGKYKSRGYIKVWKPEHPFCDSKNYVLEHRLVMEEKIERYLKPEEVVHHINEVKDDNRIENLKLFLNEREHQKYHHLSNA